MIILYTVHEMACDKCNCYFSFRAIFCLFTPLTAPKISKLKKDEKKNDCRYHHLTQVYQKSWSLAILFLIVRDGFNSYFSFWAIFCPFTPLTAQKIKILKKQQKNLPGDVIISHMCIISDNHMMYGSWDIKLDKNNFL